MAALLLGQQVADTSYEPPLGRPARFAAGEGPVVAIDEAHFNFHTAEGRYLPFAKLVRRDGYVVRSNTEPFTRKSLAGVKVLVIANALHRDNAKNWSLPRQSAFTPEEIRELRDWVELDGGRLLLIADHMPFAGAAMDLGKAFGIEFTDGYVNNGEKKPLPDLFTKDAQTLVEHEVTEGITSIGTFTGSAFRSGGQAKLSPLLVLGPHFVSITPKVPGKIQPDDPRESVASWLQGGLLQPGKGRLAIFGEAAMFSAQLAGPDQKRQMGMNHPDASQNFRLVLNLMDWLSK